MRDGHGLVGATTYAMVFRQVKPRNANSSGAETEREALRVVDTNYMSAEGTPCFYPKSQATEEVLWVILLFDLFRGSIFPPHLFYLPYY